MRANVGSLACLAAMAAMASVTLAAPEAAPQGNSTPPDSTPTYYLRGYFKLDSQRPVWQASDSSPWSQVKTKTPWVDRRLVKWGYTPFTHDSKNYYCLIDDGPRTGSHVIETTFMCGDPATVQWLFQNNWKPSIPMTGGGPPLESSLRPRPSSGN
jgi:hypothetical protein